LRPDVDQQLTDWAISVIGVIVFVGLTAYDTQRIKEMYDVNDDCTILEAKEWWVRSGSISMSSIVLDAVTHLP